MSKSKHFYHHKSGVLISKKCEALNKTCYHHVSINNRFAKMSKDEIRSLAKKKRIKLDKHFDLVNLNVFPACIGSFPCAHKVSVKEKPLQILTAPQIKQLYVRFKMEIPDHFKSF